MDLKRDLVKYVRDKAKSKYNKDRVNDYHEHLILISNKQGHNLLMINFKDVLYKTKGREIKSNPYG